MIIRKPKPVRKIIVSIIILLVLILMAGTVYVYLVDRNNKPKTVKTSANQQIQALPTPVAPASNVPEGVAVEAVSSPVAIGSDASISVLTNAGSTCDIVFSSNGAQTKNPALTPATANAYGSVNWTWTITDSEPIGNLSFTITCYYHSRSGVGTGNIQVTK